MAVTLMGGYADGGDAYCGYTYCGYAYRAERAAHLLSFQRELGCRGEVVDPTLGLGLALSVDTEGSVLG